MREDASAASATRSNLLRARRRLLRVQKGIELLRRKREALVTELFRLAKPAADERARIDEQAARTYRALLEALALAGPAGLTAVGWPERRLEVAIDASTVWGVEVATLGRTLPVRRSIGARSAAPGSTGPAVAESALATETLVERLLDAASKEIALQRLGESLARTSRQLNTLERRVAPALAERIGNHRRILDDREREERLRLTHLLGVVRK